MKEMWLYRNKINMVFVKYKFRIKILEYMFINEIIATIFRLVSWLLYIYIYLLLIEVILFNLNSISFDNLYPVWLNKGILLVLRYLTALYAYQLH